MCYWYFVRIDRGTDPMGVPNMESFKCRLIILSIESTNAGDKSGHDMGCGFFLRSMDDFVSAYYYCCVFIGER